MSICLILTLALLNITIIELPLVICRIGYDYLPDFAVPEAAAELSVITEEVDPDDMLPQMAHAYSSVFVLMHLGIR